MRSSWVLPFVVIAMLPFALPKIWFSNPKNDDAIWFESTLVALRFVLILSFLKS